jgi:hypothetical protein
VIGGLGDGAAELRPDGGQRGAIKARDVLGFLVFDLNDEHCTQLEHGRANVGLNRFLNGKERGGPHLGALLTDDGKLIHAGRVGTGMPDKVLAYRRRLEPLSRAKVASECPAAAQDSLRLAARSVARPLG